jgi:uncharacterized membrane protein (UPF0136 family)
MLIFGVLSCVLGFIAMIGPITASNKVAGAIVAGIIFGALFFAAGVLTLKNTRGGRVWWGLTGKERALSAPGLILGGFLGVIIIPVVLFGVMIMRMSAEAWS